MRTAILNDWRLELNIENIGTPKYVEDGVDEALAVSLSCRATIAWHDLTGRVVLQGREWLAIFGGGVGLAILLLGKTFDKPASPGIAVITDFQA